MGEGGKRLTTSNSRCYSEERGERERSLVVTASASTDGRKEE